MRFFELHCDLPREGPGDDASTARALAALPGLPACPEILDVGCGPGAQTLVLAHRTGGTITAVDVHQPFLDALERRAREAGLRDAIRPLRASMTALPFAPASFDLIWSEGAIYVMGFANGLRAWRPLLRPRGFLVVSELSWLRPDPHPAARAFWDEAYPAMQSRAQNRATIAACGYEPITDFVVPAASWFTNYYEPLEVRIDALAATYADEPQTLRWLAEERREIAVARSHGDAFGYVFYAMRLPTAP